MKSITDLTGQRFRSLVVLGFDRRDQAPNGTRKYFWHVQCDCGATKSVLGANLRQGVTGSCGCQERGVGQSWAHKGQPTWLVKMWNQYRGGARNRGLAFDLTIDQVQALAQGSCHYCGTTPANGIDRMDSTQGYNVWNAVSCCATCNRMKMALGYDLFVAQAKRIAAHVK